MRGSKTVNGAKTIYQYLDGKLYYQETNGDDTYFYYDSYGNIIAIATYLSDGTAGYVFVGTNSLGDVNALYNANGDLLVKYEYDAWGKVIAETDANGNALTGSAKTWNELNPFRYRGYVYDRETQLYYLQSRYYDPEVGRFISADETALITVSPKSSYDKNFFAYCDNNPVVRVDDGGGLWTAAVVVGAVVGGATSLVSTALTEISNIQNIGLGKFALKCVASCAIGAVSGGLTVVAPQYSVYINAGSGALDSFVGDLIEHKDWKTITSNVLVSAGFGALSGIGGSDFAGKGGDIVNTAARAYEKTQKGNHPVVKGAATKTINEAKKFVTNKYKVGQLTDTVVSFIKNGVQEATNWFRRTLFGE